MQQYDAMRAALDQLMASGGGPRQAAYAAPQAPPPGMAWQGGASMPTDRRMAPQGRWNAGAALGGNYQGRMGGGLSQQQLFGGAYGRGGMGAPVGAAYGQGGGNAYGQATANMARQRVMGNQGGRAAAQQAGAGPYGGAPMPRVSERYGSAQPQDEQPAARGWVR